MAKLALFGILGVVVVGGGAGAWYLSTGGGTGLDAAGRDILARYQKERAKDPVDEEALRTLVRDLKKHPDGAADRSLLRVSAWCQMALGNSARAYEAIHGNLGFDVTPEDLELGSRILMARHAETGDPDLGDQALSCAQQHYEAAGAEESLFRAWQMAVRLRNAERREPLQKQLLELKESPYGKVVAALPKYPYEVNQSAGARSKFLALADTFDDVPHELSLAIAWWEVNQGADHRLTGQQRAEKVQREFRVSRTARTLIAAAAITSNLKQYKKAKSHLEWLLRTYKDDPQKGRQAWQSMLSYAETKLAEGDGK